MEELRSTEVLEKEILEDARKKTMRIQKTASLTLDQQKLDWEKKICNAVDSIRNKYSTRLKKNTDEVFARFSLDKRRLRSENAESNLIKVMKDFLFSLKREKLLSILKEDLSQRLELIINEKEFGEESNPKLFYSGLDLNETKQLLESIMTSLPNKGNDAFFTKDWEYIKDPVYHEFPSIVINTTILKITASVENVVSSLMKDKRAELASALLGEEVLND